jgi:hypothetical protein
MSGRTKTFLAVLVLFVLLVGHWLYWYQPRARPGAVPVGGPVAELLEAEECRLAVWLPYPHQNLGFLRQRAGLEEEAYGALARLVELPTPELPRFGQLLVPPASELAFALAGDGRRFAVRARVYPLFGAFARLSGRLADNPWLAGGELYRDGLRITVSWQGNVWRVTSEGFGEGDRGAGGEKAAAAGPALAHLVLPQASPPVPAGRYRLLAEDGGLEVVSEPAPGEPRGFDVLDLRGLGTILFAYTGGGTLTETPQSLLFLGQDDPQALDLPRVAVVYREGAERWSVPGESLLEITGQKPRESLVEGWRVAALDRSGLGSAERLAERLGVLETPRADGTLRWALWLDLEAALAEVSRLAYMMGQVPLVPPRQVQRWRDIETVLAAVADGYDVLRLEISGGETAPAVARLSLTPRVDR